MKGLRLPLPRRPDPVLSSDEIEFIDTLMEQHLEWVKHKLDQGRVSESVLRTKFYAESVRDKLGEVLGR